MMSLVTRCPACGTHFKVVPDQLRISEGWVRCGQCDEVFDAQAHMQPLFEDGLAQGPDTATAPMPPQEVWSAQAVDSAAVIGDGAAPARAPEPVPGAHALVMEPEPEPEAEAEPAAQTIAPERGYEASELQEVHPQDSDDSRNALADAVPGADPGHGGVPGDALDFAHSAHPIHEELDAAFQPSFLHSARPAPVPQRRWIRASLLVLLGGMLLLQVLVQQRDRIAATEPVLASGLQSLCEAVGCQIAPLRQIESIVIESSSFIKVKADVYRLSFSIKNTALVPLALPFAELALTDLRDQSVLRRVLAPTEYGARGEILAPGEELMLVVPVAIKATAHLGDKVTGYRLLVFYP